MGRHKDKKEKEKISFYEKKNSESKRTNTMTTTG